MGIFDLLKRKKKEAESPLLEETKSLEVNQSISVKLTTEQKTNLLSPIEDVNPVVPDSRGKSKTFLFFDTETNNASSERKAIQLAWILTDDQGYVLEYKNYYLNHDVVIDPYAQRAHGIDEMILSEEGSDPVAVYTEFLSAVDKCDCLVAHNMAFDMKTIENDLDDLNFKYNFDGKILLCTMEQSKQIVQAKDKNGHLKNPRLDELATFLFNDETEDMLENMHDAYYDTCLLKNCFFKLKELIVSGQITKP
ncbi:3'-5' exonuclease, partial [Parabacteroides leei]